MVKFSVHLDMHDAGSYRKAYIPTQLGTKLTGWKFVVKRFTEESLRE